MLGVCEGLQHRHGPQLPEQLLVGLGPGREVPQRPAGVRDDGEGGGPQLGEQQRQTILIPENFPAAKNTLSTNSVPPFNFRTSIVFLTIINTKTKRQYRQNICIMYSCHALTNVNRCVDIGKLY